VCALISLEGKDNKIANIDCSQISNGVYCLKVR
jgi:hypothetical protein